MVENESDEMIDSSDEIDGVYICQKSQKRKGGCQKSQKRKGGRQKKTDADWFCDLSFRQYTPLRLEFCPISQSGNFLKDHYKFYLRNILTRRETSEVWCKADLGEYEVCQTHKLVAVNGKKITPMTAEEVNQFIAHPANFPLTLRVKKCETMADYIKKEKGVDITVKVERPGSLGLKLSRMLFSPMQDGEEKKGGHIIQVNGFAEDRYGFVNMAKVAGIKEGDWLVALNGNPVLPYTFRHESHYESRQLNVVQAFLRNHANYPLTMQLKRFPPGTRPSGRVREPHNRQPTWKTDVLSFFLFRTKQAIKRNRETDPPLKTYYTRIAMGDTLAKHYNCVDPKAEKVVLSALGSRTQYSVSQLDTLHSISAEKAKEFFRQNFKNDAAYRYMYGEKDWVSHDLDPPEGAVQQRMNHYIHTPAFQRILEGIRSETSDVDPNEDIMFYMFRKKFSPIERFNAAGKPIPQLKMHFREMISVEAIKDQNCQRVLLKGFRVQFVTLGIPYLISEAKKAAEKEFPRFMKWWPMAEETDNRPSLKDTTFSCHLMHILRKKFESEIQVGGKQFSIREGVSCCQRRGACATCFGCIVHQCQCVVIGGPNKNKPQSADNSELLKENRNEYEPLRQDHPETEFERKISDAVFLKGIDYLHDYGESTMNRFQSYQRDRPLRKDFLNYIQQAAAIKCEFKPTLCRTLTRSALDFVGDIIDISIEELVSNFVSGSVLESDGIKPGKKVASKEPGKKNGNNDSEKKVGVKQVILEEVAFVLESHPFTNKFQALGPITEGLKSFYSAEILEQYKLDISLAVSSFFENFNLEKGRKGKQKRKK